jgi:NADH-quinone oxidoreductase subunit M
MQLMGIGVLTWLTFLPVLGMVLVLLIPKDQKDAIRWSSLIVTLIQLLLSIGIFMKFDRGLAGINSEAGMQFVEKASWIDIKSIAWFGRIHIDYFVGIDGLSVTMVILTALISAVGTLRSPLKATSHSSCCLMRA